MTYEEWWLEFTSVHPDWRYADSEALRKAAFESGAASRDAEVVSLTNQRDYEYVRAENAEQERDQLREQIASLKDELRQISTAIDDVRLDLTNTAAELIMEMKEQLSSRDTEVAELQKAIDENWVTHQQIVAASKERDQLREQVKMLRDALQITHELYTQASSGYGFAHPENPHNFHCDIDRCSKEEIAAHSKACDDYAAGRKVSNDSWGIGTYCDEYAPAIEALAATEQNP